MDTDVMNTDILTLVFYTSTLLTLVILGTVVFVLPYIKGDTGRLNTLLKIVNYMMVCYVFIAAMMLAYKGYEMTMAVIQTMGGG